MQGALINYNKCTLYILCIVCVVNRLYTLCISKANTNKNIPSSYTCLIVMVTPLIGYSVTLNKYVFDLPTVGRTLSLLNLVGFQNALFFSSTILTLDVDILKFCLEALRSYDENRPPLAFQLKKKKMVVTTTIHKLCFITSNCTYCTI